MPSIIGNIQVANIGGGVVNFGDTLNIAPKSTEKTFSGSGAGNTAAIVITNNGLSSTNTIDKDLIDQPQTANQ